MKLAPLRRTILTWYRRHARDLPWRRTTDPYAILVSEVMLQQTQVDRVVPKFGAFMRAFPNLRALARAPLADVLRVWSGLGYNGRARRLWACARKVVHEHRGRMPEERSALEALPGIGPYTAGAVASFAFGAREACVDTNIKRVLARAIDGDLHGDARRVWELAREALPRGPSGEWNQAVMEVGAVFCKPLPRCAPCPVRMHCKAWSSGVTRSVQRHKPKKARKFHGSRRYYRGRVVKALAQVPALSFMRLGVEVKPGFRVTDLPWLEDLLADLEADGLVSIDRRRAKVRIG